MGCLSLKYQVLCLLSFLFHSTPSSLSSSLSSISPCSALLHFNKSMPLDRRASPSYHSSRIQMCDNSYPKTASWKEDTDCCTWDGVVCHQTTRHVIGLDLSCSWLSGPIHSNSTLFFLPHLRTLNLAGNCFNESLISPEFGKFKTLTHLNLSYSCFSGKIPNEISHLSSLVSLDLSLNGGLLIETPVWKRVIHNLTQLRELLLDWSNMSSIRPNSLMNLSSSFTTLSLNGCYLQGKLHNNILCLPIIQTLDLGFNDNLDLGSLPKCNWSSSTLKFLDLSSISFLREFLDSISNLKSLKVLALDNCNFTGSIPTSLGNLTQITTLYLSKNKFTGSIPTSFENLTKLTTLDLSINNFNGLLSLSLLKLPNLSTLFLENNQLVGPLPNHVSGLLNLNVLSLRSNFLNGTLPSWLFNLPSLVRLNLYDNQFIGEIGEFKPNSLEYLDLSYNKLHGSIPRSLFNLPNLSTLILDNNQLVGPLPNHVSGLLNLNVLSLHSNFLNGTLPSWLFSLPYLGSLNLAGNQFIGEIGEFKSNSLEDLDLGHNMLLGSIPRSISRIVSLISLYFSSNNLSIVLESEMFSKLKNLKYLDFSNNLVSINNNVTYTLPNLYHLNLSSTNISEFPIFLRTTTNLQLLDLSKNRINGQFPRWLGDVGRDSLYFLDLRANLLQGSFPTLSFPSLQYLFASNNKFTGEIPSLICNTSSLYVLDLSHNNLSGVVPKCLVHSNVLLVLDLQMNSLHGTIPATFSKSNILRNINLNGNQLEGPLPRSLENCRNLEVLDLGSNKINGTFPYWLEGLSNLRVLVIRSNKFQGHIGNPKTKSPFPNLRILDISNNEFNGPLPRKYFKYLKAMTNVDEGNVTLKYMGDGYYHNSLNVMMKGLYTELVRIQTVFTTIDFSNNSFRGEMPMIIGRLKSLNGLNFSHNNLTGYIPSSFGNLHNLVWLDLSFNKFTGEIPMQLDLRANLLQGSFPTLSFPRLRYLFVSNNKLTGEIPSSICNASTLDVLDLSHNNLSGMLPKCLVHSNVLSVLDLRMNSLHGTIPATFSKRNNFRNINLNGNQLEGSLPRSLANCRNLEVLDLGSNKINETFPYWLEGLSNLRALVIRSNKFQGRIGNPKTRSPFPNLRILDISNNEFNGPLPRKYFKYLKAMTNVDEGKVTLKYMGDGYYHDSLNVMMKGLYIELVRIQTVFTAIDFSNNSFRGEMPMIIGRLKSLKGLNFSHNNLIGYIPSSFGNLQNLEWLDLSFNKLTGEIPRQLADLPWLEVLKLSHNQLTGLIPSGKQFNTFDNDSYIENLGLCGFPLSRMCNNHEAKNPPLLTSQQEDKLEPENGFGWQAVSTGYGCGVLFGTLMGYLMFKIKKPKWIVRMVRLEQHIMLRRLKKNAQRHGGKK